MKIKLLIFLFLFQILTTQAFANDTKKQDLSFEINAEGSRVNYNMVTYTDSILKWRDSKGVGGNIALHNNLSENSKISLRYS